jgi:selenocysteine lyase/cysteine desulfurase
MMIRNCRMFGVGELLLRQGVGKTSGAVQPCIRLKHTEGYQAMGSFHSEDVDVLMAQSDTVYKAPPLPFEITMNSDAKDEDDFLLDRKNWTFLNHGAFGAALRVGYDRAEQWRFHLERQPLRYFDRDLLPHLVCSARRMADFCGVGRDDDRASLTLVPNVTFALNTVLQGYSRHYKKQAHVIVWDTSYGSLKKMASRYCSGNVTEIPVSNYFPLFDVSGDPNRDVFEQALLDTLNSMSERNVNLKDALLILDHTTSNTALNMPLASLSRIAKGRGMLVMVDGAHGLLGQHVDLKSLEHIDFYLANGHKWLSCPRGIGVLYCPHEELRETVLEWPAVMSHGVGQGFQSRFLWDGCRDYAAALSVPAVLDFWQAQNVGLVQAQMHRKLQDAVALLGLLWHESSDNTNTVRLTTLAPMSVHAPMMALVMLPLALQRFSKEGRSSKQHVATSDDAKRIQDYLFDQRVEVPIKCIRGVLYVRISCHVYNELSEYERLGKTLLDTPRPL